MAFIKLPNEKLDISEAKYFLLLIGKEILLHKDLSLPTQKEFSQTLKIVDAKNAFYEDQFRYAALMLEESDIPLLPFQSFSVPIRATFASRTQEEIFIFSRARTILKWRSSMKFCQECGKRLSDSDTLSAMECSSCKTIYFPRTDPCVIVLVKNGEKMLLVRHAKRNPEDFLCVSGFIEAGETPEEAAVREVLEETGITVKNPVYKGSQSWPFPNQLMMAFTAEYESGKFSVQQEEILEAKWFSKDKIPNSLKPGSVAWRLVNDKFQAENHKTR